MSQIPNQVRFNEPPRGSDNRDQQTYKRVGVTRSTDLAPVVRLQIPELVRETGLFLIDTGSDINLVKREALRNPEDLNYYNTVNILGITDDRSSTMGTCILHFQGRPNEFHVTDLPLPDGCDGIIGAVCLESEEAEISYHHKTMVTVNDPGRPIRFFETQPPRKARKYSYTVKARMRQMVTVPIKDCNLKEGYLPKVELPRGLYLGNAVVKNENGTCYAYVVNTRPEAIKINIPPQTLESFDEEFEIDDFRDFPFPEEPVDEDRDRLTEIEETLNLNHLSSEEMKSVLELIQDFPDIFHLPNEPLPATNVCKHKIPTTDNQPINARQYHFPPIHKEEIDKQVSQMLKAAIIQPSKSSYNSPLWIVPKKCDSKENKRWRLVIDFRQLNSKTISDAYPLPNITDILDRLGGAKIVRMDS